MWMVAPKATQRGWPSGFRRDGYIGSVEGQVDFEGMAVAQGQDKVLVRFGFESKEDGLVSISFEGIGKEIKVSFGDQVEKLDESEGGGEVDGGNGSKEEQLRGVSIKMRTEVPSAGEKEKKPITWWKVPLKVLKSCVWKVGHGWTFTVACKLSLPAEAIHGVSRLIHGGYKGLVKWKGPPTIENTGEPYEPIVLPFPDLHLEDKVNLEGEGNDRTHILHTHKGPIESYQRIKKGPIGTAQQNIGETDGPMGWRSLLSQRDTKKGQGRSTNAWKFNHEMEAGGRGVRA